VTRDDIIAMAQESVIACPNENPFDFRLITLEQIEHFAALVAAAEREACAKVCERLADMVSNNNWVAIENRKLCATEIRKGEMK
jgi:predicted ATPase